MKTDTPTAHSFTLNLRSLIFLVVAILIATGIIYGVVSIKSAIDRHDAAVAKGQADRAAHIEDLISNPQKLPTTWDETNNILNDMRLDVHSKDVITVAWLHLRQDEIRKLVRTYAGSLDKEFTNRQLLKHKAIENEYEKGLKSLSPEVYADKTKRIQGNTPELMPLQ